ncbi:MAG: L,D-transpeptidase family protein, partial [Verrucomicrobiota bacterium]
ALMDKNYALMRLLLSQGVSPDLPNMDDLKPLTYAVRYGDEHAALLLLESGATLNAETKVTGHTLFEWTLAWKQPMLAEVLIQHGADPNQRISSPVRSEFLDHFEGRGNLQFYLKNDTGLTPLMVVAGSGQYEMLTMLREKGASKSHNTYKWKSWPINFAVKAEDIRMSQMLLGRDPDTDGKDRKIVVNLKTQKATFYEHGEVIYSSSVSTGKKGYRTEPGVFVITNKDRMRRSNLYNANMPYFMRLNCSAIGMHQGNIPGYPASHGCIRLPSSYAKKFFATAQVGDIVEIK